MMRNRPMGLMKFFIRAIRSIHVQ